MWYKYNSEYNTLQQYDDQGVLRSSMSMPKSDLEKIAFMAWVEEVDKNYDKEVDSQQN